MAIKKVTKTTAKKETTKKVPAKKPVAKKTETKKVVAKKPPVKKAETKKVVAKKPVAKKETTKKVTKPKINLVLAMPNYTEKTYHEVFAILLKLKVKTINELCTPEQVKVIEDLDFFMPGNGDDESAKRSKKHGYMHWNGTSKEFITLKDFLLNGDMIKIDETMVQETVGMARQLLMNNLPKGFLAELKKNNYFKKFFSNPKKGVVAA